MNQLPQVVESMDTLQWDQIHVLESANSIPSNLQPLTELSLVIIVGLTGVGKTTTLELLSENGASFSLLPNRRKITDEVIIASLQQEDGDTSQPITDRLARFEYTARYRAKHPGGMAYALSRLAIERSQVTSCLIFDGLRGLDEVQQATACFPRVRFVVLDAPDTTRFSRLMKRNDAFDAVNMDEAAAGHNVNSALVGIPNIETVFNREQMNQIAQVALTNRISTDEVVQKVSIIVKERHHYDSHLAQTYLVDTLSRQRVLLVDTADHPVHQVAKQIGEWLGFSLR